MSDDTLPAKEVVKSEETPVLSEQKKQEPEVKEEEKPVELPQEDWRTSPLFYELAHYLGVEEKVWGQSAEKMSVIADWAAQQAKSSKVQDLLPVIRKLEDTIMRPSWGETRVDNLYRYLRLAVKRDSFDKALKAFERNPQK